MYSSHTEQGLSVLVLVSPGEQGQSIPSSISMRFGSSLLLQYLRTDLSLERYVRSRGRASADSQLALLQKIPQPSTYLEIAKPPEVLKSFLLSAFRAPGR
jgi:hypothetical protein